MTSGIRVGKTFSSCKSIKNRKKKMMSIHELNELNISFNSEKS